MSERIEVRIDEQGRVHVEFSGFAGDACLEEAERLQRALVALGVKVSVDDLIMKSAGQIDQELGLARERRGQVRAGGDDE